MVNVSLEVAINNGVSAKGKDQTEQAEESGFLAMLAQAEQGSGDETSQSDTQSAGEYAPLPEGLDRRLGLDDSHLPKKQNTAPDEPLRLDDSELPGKGSAAAGSGANPSDADELLAQITSSNAQSTDVAHNLAPVPKALKDYLGKETLVVPPETKKPLDNIGPGPVVPAPLGQEELSQTDDAVDLKLQEATSKSVIAGANALPDGNHLKGKIQVESVDELVIHKRVDRVGPGITQPSDSSGPVADELLAKGEGKPASIMEALKSDNAEINLKGSDKAQAQAKPVNAEQPLPGAKPVTTEASSVQANPLQTKPVNAQEISLQHEQTPEQVAVHKPVTEKVPFDGKIVQRPVDQVGPVITAPQGDQKEAKLSDKVQSEQSEFLRNSKSQVSVADNVTKAQQPVQPPQGANVNSTADLKAMVDTLTPQQKQTLAANLQSQLDSKELSDPEHRAKAEQLLQQLGVKPTGTTSGKAEGVTAPVVSNVEQSGQAEQAKVSDKDNNTARITDPIAPEKVNKQAATVSQSGANSVDQKPQSKDAQQQTTVTELQESEHPELAQLKKEGGQSEQQNSQQRSAMPAPVENIFKAIRGERIDDGLKHEFNEVLAQVEQVRQNQQVNQQSAVNQKAMQTDPAVSQAINIARNDAVKALQERVNMMLNINNKEAEIRLDPPELGSMQIRIRSEGEQAQVNFVVQNQQAKEQLEQSMPKLREMLAEQGIQLGESNIQQGQGGEQQQQESSQGHGTLANNGSEAQNNGQQSTTSRRQSDSAIDYYA
ncbi:flagellar hook-length control protein FliK [Pseudoalteromonas sp. McH1-42]|uniref:flagellar hook-length control protein FliK n=1 Tax=Pseudoalteromonas sp. McH1-42 TaxID=2917752 RepID=UPI001EF44D13|nr:flagellar hook-length control protein FliK [Pseudoalteromonas sp. McH1-42]MCG7563566.1 flagellar hook-length control protein FliK [Pseudoalteromonas sp. McH1-42]